MIGAIVEGLDQNSEFSPLIYHRFSEETVLEMTVRHCLHAGLVHKVIAAMPSSERRKCGELNLRRGRTHSGWFHYYEVPQSLDLVYSAANEHSLDHIVRIRANNCLVPSWLINDVVKFYFQNGGLNYCRSHRSPGLDVEVFPFWMLANIWTYADERGDFTSDPVLEKGFINTRGLDLTFNNIDNLERWDYFVRGVNKGHDIEDLIQEVVNGNQSGDTKQSSVIE